MSLIDSIVESTDVPPQTVEMTIIAQDPTVKGEDGRILRAKVRVPAARLEPGPRSARFHVIDYDSTESVLAPPADLTDIGTDQATTGRYVDRFADAPDKALLADPAFHAQQVYAVAARTLAVFENALGRRLSWGFLGHQLHIVPHAFAEANAYYSDDDRAVLFGYIPMGSKGKTRVYTCLSHDVVAHETAHAVLDGLRHRFLEPGLPDQAAFHEALADLVALLSVFSLAEVVEPLLGPATDGRLPGKAVQPKALRKNALFGVAEQMGQVLTQGRGALRQSGTRTAGDEWLSDLAFEEPHLRGEILVAIVVEVLVDMWFERLDALIHAGFIDRARAAEEGAKAANHLLTMVLRAIDYLPPVEFEYADFLDAIVTSDKEVAPDDRHDYRGKLVAAFGSFGIKPSLGGRVIDLTGGGFVPLYHGLNFGALRTDPDEVYRFLWENARALGVDTTYYTHVEAVRPSVRVGPDGLVVNEAVADYVQMLELEAHEFAGLAGVDPSMLPDGVAPDTKLQLLGGGTLIFDQFGRAKYHVSKPLHDWARQVRRLDYLARAGFVDTKGRLGFSISAPAGQRFAELHDPAGRAGEVW
jgi:hypothetical protein